MPMVRGEAKHCTDHIVGIATQQVAFCSQYKHAGHIIIMSWSHYYCVMRVGCIWENEMQHVLDYLKEWLC